MYRIIIFASGSGTNAENIIRHFKGSPTARVNWVLCNNAKAGVIQRAEKLGVPSRVFSKTEMMADDFIDFVIKEGDFIVLAGFLLKVPEKLTKAFPKAMVNIHPALLPKYGGKGMYGMNVHRSVVANKEQESGITIHYVNDKYDDGAVIFQKKVQLTEVDGPEEVAAKIHDLEQENFPQVIEKLLSSQNEG